jgi:hypothetical protein
LQLVAYKPAPPVVCDVGGSGLGPGAVRPDLADREEAGSLTCVNCITLREAQLALGHSLLPAPRPFILSSELMAARLRVGRTFFFGRPFQVLVILWLIGQCRLPMSKGLELILGHA